MFLALSMMADQNGMSELSGRKESNCVRCRNHGMKIILRGHKQYCPYAACACDKCRFTAEQQRQMRLQNAIRRAEAHDRTGTQSRRQRNSTTAAPTMVSPQHSQQQQTVQPPAIPQPPPQIQQPQQIIITTVANALPDQRNGGTPHGKKPILLFIRKLQTKTGFDFLFIFSCFARDNATDDKKLFFDCSSELLKKFRYPWEMMPIMYALSKYANGNIEEILQKIDEGLAPTITHVMTLSHLYFILLGQFAVNEQLRLQTLNMYFGAAQNNPTTVPATRECG